MIKYMKPRNWLNYDWKAVTPALTEAKAAVLSLVQIPYQRSWVEPLQAMQLKREIAGTSRIEGADFTERELDAALKGSTEELLTRSQKQAHAATVAYKYISGLPVTIPVDSKLIAKIHELIIGDADSDHCEPGVIRGRNINVTFGVPPHRGCEGGEECERAFRDLSRAISEEFNDHDLLIQALALHFHFAAMHPFLDGNGRTARATEALMLRKAGLTNHLFIAMSNYYYDEKPTYLSALSAVTPPDYDITPFVLFGLAGVKLQCERLFAEIRRNLSKSIFKNTMIELFGRLQTGRKTLIGKRHTAILDILLEKEELAIGEFMQRISPFYGILKAGKKAMVRDLFHLLEIGAIKWEKNSDDLVIKVKINLDWPQQITESGFMEQMKKLPKAKAYSFLSGIR